MVKRPQPRPNFEANETVGTDGKHAMAWPYFTGTLKIVVEITVNDKIAVNVHFATKQGGAPVDPLDNVVLADAVADSYITNLMPELSSDAQLTQVSAINWEAANGRIGFTTAVLPVVGGQAGVDSLPNNVAAVVSNRTNFTGRSRRGRTYYTGLPETGVNSNIITSAALNNALILTSQGIGANAVVEGYDHVVYSLYANGVPRATPSPVKISEYTINTRVDTQRRRLPA